MKYDIMEWLNVKDKSPYGGDRVIIWNKDTKEINIAIYDPWGKSPSADKKFFDLVENKWVCVEHWGELPCTPEDYEKFKQFSGE